MSVGDAPRSAYRVLELRATVAVGGILLTLAGLAWWSTVRRADDMTGMVQGIGSLRTADMSFQMNAVIFLAMWATMMVAMMFPTVAPIVLLHRMVVRRRGGGTSATIAFASGYLALWTVAGLVPLAVLIGFRHVAHDTGWIAPLAGAVLVLAGCYQFTGWKQTCQRSCRNPLSFLMAHDFGVGLPGALRTGASHGLYCLGCCWALMSVLVVVGLMNLVWMAAVSVVFLAEKSWRHGAALSKVAGIAVALLGLAVLVHPALLTSIAA